MQPAPKISGTASAEYICDMLKPLHGMAQETGHPILAGLLWLSHIEACRIRDEARRKTAIAG